VPRDERGNGNTNATRTRPYDQVLADEDLQALQSPTRLHPGGGTYPTGLVVDTRVHSALGEIAPARRGDSGAPEMQHMAVVKDFALASAD
jgi:hypothetical protein